MRVYATQQVEVDLNDEAIKKVTIQKIRKTFDLPSSYTYIKNGFLCYDYEVYTSHSWTETEKVREATPTDIAACEILRGIMAS